ncbi:hypothetical protein E2562_006842 [Oryza meyeriana var. granulata]|uniref:RING-type domain-containing protein n=1 Tax=Oryza meyeriana var. granulata TaxID=110450 RepID=A0A6G1C3U7_9ORYZ|nr:hypothetical protein E2562_006842 [Oryza meyeriana var. granulata]
MASSSRRVGGEDDDEPYLLGFIVAKAVGLRHYDGGRTITSRENVGLVREPLNRYDRNAIRVDNSRGVKAGHIDAPTAAVLAPLLDGHHLAAVHGIVPKPTSKNPFRLPCQVHLFTRPAAAALVGAALAAAGLDLIHVDHPEFALSESAIVQEQTKKSQGDVDKLFSHVGKEGKARVEPMEAPGDGSPVMDIEWFRVILDEAHVIKNSAARQTKAVIALNAERRWVVTGTPIQNSSLDLYPLMAFLRFQPFSIKSYWQSLIQCPLERKNNETGLARLQSLLGAISLRRTKETESGSTSLVSIPPKTVFACYIELSAEEREYYDQMELEGKKKLQEFGDRDSILRNYSTVLYFILRLRQLCNDIALCPLDMKSWLPGSSLEDVSKNPELLKKLASLVDDGDDFECPICLSPPAKTVITSCRHIYCQTCIMKILKSSSSRCPICRHSLCKEDLFIAPEIKHPDEDLSANIDRPLSSKVQALLKQLRRSQNEDPLSKSVVFSQFRKMLILLEGPLKAAGFNILRLDGSMTAKKRSEVIQQFGHVGPGAPTVLLASLKAAGAGVNLTAASTVYLFDPWWNPGVEEQAMDRVHRIGQTKEVKVVRLIVKDSIEDRMLELQEKKRKLITGAFGKKKGGKEYKEIRVEELQMMMGMKMKSV